MYCIRFVVSSDQWFSPTHPPVYIHKPYLLGSCWLMSGLGISSISSFIAALHLCPFLTQRRLKTLLPTLQKNHQMAKKLPWTRMGTLTGLLACGIFGGKQEEGGRTTLARHRIVWPNGVTACGPGPNRGANLRSTAISSFCTTQQKAFMGRLRNAKNMQKLCKTYAKNIQFM